MQNTKPLQHFVRTVKAVHATPVLEKRSVTSVQRTTSYPGFFLFLKRKKPGYEFGFLQLFPKLFVMILEILVFWRLYHIRVTSRIQPPFITSNSPRSRFRSRLTRYQRSTFQRTMHFVHRRHFTLKAHVSNVISPAQFGRFARNKSAKQSFAVSWKYLFHISILFVASDQD